MEQKSNDAAVKDARIKLRKEESAKGMAKDLLQTKIHLLLLNLLF